MRKKELKKEVERLTTKLYLANIDEKFKDIPEMDVTHCELCGTMKLNKDMVKYKRKWGDNWNIFYVCKECSKKNN